MKILIVDDEPPLVQALEYRLRQEGFDTLVARDGISALELFRKDSPDLVVLDLMLPGMSGLEVCKAIRRHSQTPIIMLTARSEEADRVVGLEIGADDYIAKPFSMRELVARIKAQTRRVSLQAPSPPALRLEAGEMLLDSESHRFWLRGSEVALSPREFQLLAVFLSRPGVAISRRELLRQAWNETAYVDERTVDVHVRWLREKIELNPSAPIHIQTVRGIGYRFEP